MIQILLTSSVLILVLVAMRKLLRGKISLRLQYALWLLVALHLLVPVQIGASDFSLSSLSQKPEQAVQSLMERPLTQTQQLSAPVTQDVPDVQTPPAQQAAPQTVEISEAQTSWTVGRVLRVVWLVGVGCMAAWFLAVNLVFHRKTRRNATTLNVEDSPLPVFVTASVPSPCLLGTLRPAIYLTPQAAQDERVMRHVLAHETTHFRHGDHIWALVRAICLCIYWFDPLIWWAAKLSRRDCELACDEGAIRRLGESERLPYGKTLVSMIACAGASRGLLQTATTMSETKKQIRERVEMIVRKPKMFVIAGVCLLVVLAVTVSSTFIGAKAAGPDAPVVEPTEPSTQLEEPSTEWTPDGPVEARVTDLHSGTWTREDGVEYAFAIPHIELPGADAERINAEIEQMCAWNPDTGLPGGSVGWSYDWYVLGDYLTLILSSGADPTAPFTYNYAYTICISTCREATAQELLDSAGMTQTDFLTLAEKAVTNEFFAENDTYFAQDWDGNAETIRQRVSAAAEMNRETWTPCLARDGSLCVSGWVDMFAGQGSHADVLPLTGYALSPWYTDIMGE